MSYGLAGAGAGAVAGSVIPGAGTAAGLLKGAKSGYVAGVGKYSYDQLRGAAFRELLKAGMDEESARAAAEDEAVLSALIEMGGAAVDIASLGSGRVITKLAKGGIKALGSEAAESAGKKLLKALGKYLVFDVGGEGLEEGAQTIVSIANQNRSGTGTGDLAGESLKTAWEIVSGQNPDAAAEVWNSAKEGAKIAAMFGGGLRMIDLAGQNAIVRTGGKNIQNLTSSATVQPPVDSDIISTAQLWAEQFNDAFAKRLEEIQMVNADGTTNDPSAANATQQNPGKIYHAVDYVGTVKVNGEVRDVSRRVYQRRDIDFEYSESELGKSNLERMQAGKPPIGSDGHPIHLHHILQVEKGPMVEILEVTHEQYFSQLHGLIGKGDSFRNDPVLKKQYNNFRRNYWKWRANQILGGD